MDANKEGNVLNFTSTLTGVGALVIGDITVTLGGGLTVADNTGTGTVDLVTDTDQNLGAGGTGAYAAITVTSA